MNEKRIILVGSQNAGKSTLFNQITTTHVSTANYSGATVEFKSAPSKSSLIKDCIFTDTPGLVSLSGNTPEQKITVEKLFEDSFQADLFVVVVDSTQLSRQLFLVRQLKESGVPMLVCLSMIDRLEAQGKELNVEALQEKLGVDCIAINTHDTKAVFKVVEAVEAFKDESTVKTPPSVKSPEEIQKEYLEIDKITSEVLSGYGAPAQKSADSILLHPFFGIVVFAAIMFVMFTSIFTFAGYPMDFIDGVFSGLVDLTKESLPEAWYTDLLAEGIIAGIGSVVIFLPQIIILFFFIGYLEDSGYLSRGAMLIDKPLSMIGLNGRSFVPILSGFACAIPAMMAARTIRNRAERLVTIFIIPLMSCSARLPVYIILVAFITPADKPWIGGLVMSVLYFGSIVIGTIVATVISKFSVFKKTGTSHFQLELPSMKLPLFKVVFRSTYERSWNYLKKAGPIIIMIGVSLWFLTTYPKAGADEADAVSQTYAAKVGRSIEPVMKPLGLDWRGGVAMIASFAAREVFVQSMMLMYDSESVEVAVEGGGPEEVDEDELSSQKLMARMRTVTFENSDQKIFTFSTVIGLLFFFNMALQCFPTSVVAKNEMNSWKLATLQLVGFTGIAYIGAIIIVQALRAFGFS